MSGSVELVRESYEAYRRGGFAESSKWMDPEIEWDMSNVPVPDAGVYRGHEGLAEFERAWGESWETLDLEPVEFVEVGDQVVVMVQQSGKGKLSGVEVDQHFAQVWTLRGGKLARMVMYPDRESAIEAAEATKRAAE